jgi:hypothetical protein
MDGYFTGMGYYFVISIHEGRAKVDQDVDDEHDVN